MFKDSPEGQTHCYADIATERQAEHDKQREEFENWFYKEQRFCLVYGDALFVWKTAHATRQLEIDALKDRLDKSSLSFVEYRKKVLLEAANQIVTLADTNHGFIYAVDELRRMAEEKPFAAAPDYENK